FPVRIVVPAGERDLHAPIGVVRDGSGLEVANELERVFADVRTPVAVTLDPFLQLVAEGGQVEEEVLGLLELDGRVASTLVRIDQIDRVELVAAVLALVASRGIETADWTLAFDVSIRQCAAAHRVEGAHLRLLHEVAVLVELEE